MLRLRETGVLARLRRHWFPAEEISCAAHWAEGHPLSAGDTQAVLMVLPLGCALGVLLLAAEIAFRRYRLRRPRGLLAVRQPVPVAATFVPTA